MTETAASGDATAILRARVVGDYCDVLSGSLSVRGSYDQGLVGETRATAGFCFWRGFGFGLDPDTSDTMTGSLFPLSASGELAVNVSPRFSSLRNQPRRRFSEVKYGFAVEGLRVMPSVPERGGTFIYMGFEQRWEWPGLFSGDHGFELDGGFGFFRLFRVRPAQALADRAIDFLDIRLHGTRFDEAVAIVDAYPLRLRGVGLFSSHVLLDADLGVSGSDGTISSTDCIDEVGCVEEVIQTGDNVAKVTTWVAHGGLAIGTRARGGGFGFVRRLDSNILGQLAVESRATGWYQTVDGPVVARAELFGGTATHYLDVDARGSERFAGASVDVQYQLTLQLAAGVQLDGIRTFERDEILDGRVGGSGVRAFATLSFTRALRRTDLQLDLSVLAPPAPAPDEPPADEPAGGEPPPDEPPGGNLEDLGKDEARSQHGGRDSASDPDDGTGGAAP